ncbi:MAG: LPS export ABC transporter periplasmic protein LptC [Elusimicrobiota bacterium]|jgi:LPS export ABC transporter protein LptC|nr:LPS export ABC transporter periplasmic protein LptC [Elusimicrobiota bacterium]
MKKVYILVGIIALLSLSCGRNRNIVEDSAPENSHIIEDFNITETDSGKLKMMMDSASAVIDEEKGIAKIQSPTVKFYKNGEYASILTMESAEINLETYDVKGYGKCIVNTVENERLQTTNLQYNSKENKVFSADSVEIERGGETIYGTSFEADTNLENIIIENQRITINRNR